VSAFGGQVSQSTDDGSESSLGTVNLTGTQTILRTGSGNLVYWACRFQNVTIPAGATISAASLSVFVPTGGSTNTVATIHGNLTANPSTLSSSTHYISGLAQTTNSASWTGTGTANAWNNSPDISAIITELIGQAGWASGNAMLFILLAGNATGFTIEDYDGSSSEAAELSITYTTSSAPGQVTGLTVTGDATNPTTALDLSWSAASGSPTSYTIQRASTKGGTFSNLATGVTGTTYTDSSLTPGTEYAYQVAGVNGGGTGTYSTAVAYATAPGPPTGLTAVAVSTTEIDLSWTGPTLGSTVELATPNNGYTVRQESPPGAANWSNIHTSNTPSFNVTGLSPGTAYGFEVLCLVQVNNSDFVGSISSAESAETDANTLGLVPVPGLPAGAMGIGNTPYGLTRAMRQNRVEGYRFRYPNG
jgi:cellulose 1,4-beta-cellobiosidase